MYVFTNTKFKSFFFIVEIWVYQIYKILFYFRKYGYSWFLLDFNIRYTSPHIIDPLKLFMLNICPPFFQTLNTPSKETDGIQLLSETLDFWVIIIYIDVHKEKELYIYYI